MLPALALVSLTLALLSPAAAQNSSPLLRTERLSVKVLTLTHGLAHPWSMAFLPDGRMLVSEREGRLRLLGPDFKLHPRPIEGLPELVSRGQGGLFDVVLHPDHARNGWIYWAYNAPGPGGWGTALARGQLQGHRMTNVQVLFSMLPKTRSNHHFGGRIVFDRQGMVYLTLGDRGDMERAQRLDDHAGSVIRLHDDGRIPADNPYLGRAGAKPEKWTLGNRNIQGAALHPVTGDLWAHEHGPQGGDEINLMRSGRNYGWPLLTQGVNYGSGTPIGEAKNKPGFEAPLHVWTPSIAPSGMAFVTGDRFPQWRGHLLVGALRGQVLVRLDVQNEKIVGEERLLQGLIGRIRDVRLGPDGLIYLLTDEAQGALLRLEPAGP
jgi:glucose/arabinose dehydrogenase